MKDCSVISYQSGFDIDKENGIKCLYASLDKYPDVCAVVISSNRTEAFISALSLVAIT